MKHLVLTTRRPFNARAYLIPLALLIVAELAILPYSVSLTGAEPPAFWDLILGAAIDLLLVAILAAISLLTAGRLAHLPTAGQMGISLNAVIVNRTLVINGVGGLLLGWLYWSFDLESAMLAHISADVVVHGFVPLITQQADTTRSIIVGAAVVLLIVLTIFRSLRAIGRDRALFPPSLQPDKPQVEADFSRPIMESRRWPPCQFEILPCSLKSSAKAIRCC